MKKTSALALLSAASVVLMLSACSTGSKNVAPAPAAAPVAPVAPVALPPKKDRN